MTGTVTENFVSQMTTLIGGAFTSLGQLILSPLGGLVIFAIAAGWLYKVKRMSRG